MLMGGARRQAPADVVVIGAGTAGLTQPASPTAWARPLRF